jgi:hypothetical protein
LEEHLEACFEKNLEECLRIWVGAQEAFEGMLREILENHLEARV